MAVYYSGDEVTERESLADTIAVRAPMSVPMLSRLPSKTIHNRIHEWSIDRPFTSSSNARSIGSPHANTQHEGAAYAYGETSLPLRLKAICSIQHRGMQISGTDRTVIMAGTDNTFDYRSGRLATETLNGIDNELLYGIGDSEQSGKLTSVNPRMCQGLIHWAAWTGLERCHGSAASLVDPYGTTITSDYYSVFYDYNHTNITSESFFQNVVRRITNAGGDMDETPWQFWCGDGLMSRISKFLVTDTGRNVNDRQIGAAEGGGYDYLNWIKLPNGVTVTFRTNRWLDEMSSTYTVNNTQSGTSPIVSPIGNVAERTFAGDQTLIGFKPGSVKVCWLREPGFESPNVDGDSSKLVCKAEYTLEVAHFLDVAGAGNCSS